MKTLLIIANPSKTSYSHALAAAYKTGVEKTGTQVEILDLYDLDQDIMAYESTDELRKGNCNGGEKMKQVQKLIAGNDEMVFFFPVWWGNIPAILKNFFDTNFSAGFAFNFVAGKSMPEKLLTDKTAKIFAHCDAPSFLYKIPFISGINLKKYIGSSILGFCGIKTTHFQLIGGLRNKTQEQRTQILEQLSK